MNPFKRQGTAAKNQSQQKGQGLLEYLILVALICIAAVGIVSTLGEAIQVKFTNIVHVLQNNERRVTSKAPRGNLYQKRHFRNFMNGATQKNDLFQDGL